MPATEIETERPTMTHADVMALLKRYRACDDATEWAGENEVDGPVLWATCPRGEWMLWLAAKVGVDRKRVVLAACACARLALPYVESGDDRPLRAIETAEAWTRGEATIDQVRSAYAAADAADAAYPAYAYAAADDDADAADAYAYAAARTRVRGECAALVRQHIPYAVIEAAIR